MEKQEALEEMAYSYPELGKQLGAVVATTAVMFGVVYCAGVTIESVKDYNRQKPGESEKFWDILIRNFKERNLYPLNSKYFMNGDKGIP